MRAAAQNILSQPMTKKDPVTEVGWRLRKARIAAGFAQQVDLADAVGVRGQTIYRVETAGFPLGKKTADLLAPVLNVTAAYLMYGDEGNDAVQAAELAEALVYPETAYPSLSEFLEDQDDITPEERMFLNSQRFAEGDPGSGWWASQLLSYRKHRRRSSESQIGLTPARAAELDKAGIVPLRPGPKGKR